MRPSIPPSIARDFMKWDDQPGSLQHFAELAVRAYKIAMTPPMGPVLLVPRQRDAGKSYPKSRRPLSVPPLTRVAFPRRATRGPARRPRSPSAGESGKSGDHRRPAGADTKRHGHRLVELAETLQCPVIDEGGLFQFPTQHPLNHSFRRGTLLPKDSRGTSKKII